MATVVKPPLTADDVREALRKRWPPADFITVEEAPTDIMRQGRKLDFLAMSLWRTRNLEIDGVEIKVGAGDWARELKDPSKADWWVRHVHRFWLAAPVALAGKVRLDLPEGWGLLAINQAKVATIVVRPTKHSREEFAHDEYLGLMRAMAGNSRNALWTEYSRGLDEGERRAKEHLIDYPQRLLEEERDRLRQAMAEFREVTGISLADGAWDRGEAARTARLWKLIVEANWQPTTTSERLCNQAAKLRSIVQLTQDEAARMEALAAEFLAEPEPATTTA